MTEFDSVLKRAFAEAPEPADDGFALRVGAAVAQNERKAQMMGAVYAVGMGVAAIVVFYALFPLVWTWVQEALTSFGLGVARAQGALNAEAPTVAGQARGMLQSMGAGMTQMLFVLAALAGGAVAYRAAQD